MMAGDTKLRDFEVLAERAQLLSRLGGRAEAVNQNGIRTRALRNTFLCR